MADRGITENAQKSKYFIIQRVSLPSSLYLILQHFKLHPRDHLGLEPPHLSKQMQ